MRTLFSAYYGQKEQQRINIYSFEMWMLIVTVLNLVILLKYFVCVHLQFWTWSFKAMT